MSNKKVHYTIQGCSQNNLMLFTHLKWHKQTWANTLMKMNSYYDVPHPHDVDHVGLKING